MKYMQAWEEKYYDRQEAREKGLAKGAKDAKRSMARSLAAMGVPLEKISKAAETDLETVRRWIEGGGEEELEDDIEEEDTEENDI